LLRAQSLSVRAVQRRRSILEHGWDGRHRRSPKRFQGVDGRFVMAML
jgi:hypothetical protein